ncbi:MAG TPA: aromatic-ring-hydroxylating dioxygenase subunit beta [Rhizomicrobium sp.]|nr:aromatic-ring-hydroxylating dioxygenase subunit beta [Rhizomicrobium sp.]
MSNAISRRDAEDFLIAEAELLDDWKMPEWAKLFTRDAVYEVTSPASATPLEDNPDTSLFLIADRIDRIEGRANRLMKPGTHAEFPRSKTRHLVTNIRVRAGENGEALVRANFAVYRTKEDTTTVYMGEYHYSLVRETDAVKIRRKRCILDINSLHDQGRLTIIL